MSLLHALAISLLLLFAGASLTPAAEIRVSANDMAAFNAAVSGARPGDVILLEDGEWKDAALVFKGQGTEAKPIVLRSASPGGVRLTGDSSLRLAGTRLMVEGLHFHNCFPAKWDVVMFREDAKAPASHCSLRNCAITQDVGTKDTTELKWVSLYGVGHVVERCDFYGKTSRGTLLVVWLPKAEVGPPTHQIRGNYFGPRPRLGKNGGEIIRLGDSDTSLQSAGCTVVGNLFEQCDGEVECISNKSCDNKYLQNTFIECQGTLTLRHGNRCLVEGNWFDGRHRKLTGGIRIIGEDHIVRGNHLQGLEGDGARTAICVMNGIKDSPANGYLQVKKAAIEGNTILDCKHSILIGYADKDVTALMAPECDLRDNQVEARGGKIIELLEPQAKLQWKDNQMSGGELGVAPSDGIRLLQVGEMKSTGKLVPLLRSTVGAHWALQKLR